MEKASYGNLNHKKKLRELMMACIVYKTHCSHVKHVKVYKPQIPKRVPKVCTTYPIIIRKDKMAMARFMISTCKFCIHISFNDTPQMNGHI